MTVFVLAAARVPFYYALGAKISMRSMVVLMGGSSAVVGAFGLMLWTRYVWAWLVSNGGAYSPVLI